MPLDDDVGRFFDEFVEAFPSFDGEVIARRYGVPYLAIHTDGSTELFASNTAVAAYFQRVLDGYRQRGCRACRYEGLEITATGGASALGTVTWDLLRADDTVLTSWRESYVLAYADERLKAFVSIDHAG
jgi:hypothetical protein